MDSTSGELTFHYINPDGSPATGITFFYDSYGDYLAIGDAAALNTQFGPLAEVFAQVVVGRSSLLQRDTSELTLSLIAPFCGLVLTFLDGCRLLLYLSYIPMTLSGVLRTTSCRPAPHPSVGSFLGDRAA